MNRRGLMKMLATLPFCGGLFTEAVTAAVEASPIYAEAGETVTCENGHPICEFMRTVRYGEMQNVEINLGNWKQTSPSAGTYPIPVCAKCGSPFTDGSRYHVGLFWRERRGENIYDTPYGGILVKLDKP